MNYCYNLLWRRGAVKRSQQSKGPWYILVLILAVVLLLVIQGCGGITVELSANPSEGATLTGAGAYGKGSAVTVKAVPAPGWEFVHWTLAGEVVAETQEYTFSIEGSTELMAHLRRTTYNIETKTQGKGTVVAPVDSASSESEVSLEAVPEEGYRFIQWLEADEVVSTDAIYTFNATAHRDLTAVFLPIIDLHVEKGGGSVVESWMLEPVKVTLEAKAEKDYAFFGWIDMETKQEIETKPVLALETPRKIMARFRKELIAVDGNSLISVVGKQTTIGKYEPADLVTLPDHLSRKNRRVRREVADALELMAQAAQADGVKINVDSGYRSFDTQHGLFYRYAGRDGIFEAEMYSARPGQSEHQLGTAVDFGGTSKDYSSGFFGTAQGTWLFHNAHNFGFALSYPKNSTDITGYIYEPWHYRYVGGEVAQEWKKSGLTLIEFLQDLN